MRDFVRCDLRITHKPLDKMQYGGSIKWVNMLTKL